MEGELPVPRSADLHPHQMRLGLGGCPLGKGVHAACQYVKTPRAKAGGRGVRGGEPGGVAQSLRGSCQVLMALKREHRMPHRMEGAVLGAVESRASLSWTEGVRPEQPSQEASPLSGKLRLGEG